MSDPLNTTENKPENKVEHSPSRSEFETRLQNALRASADELDGRTRSKLTQARFAAVEAAKHSPTLWSTVTGFMKARWWIPAAGGATAAVLAVVLSVNPAHFNFNGDAHRSASVFEDLEMISSDDSLELYQDMDFYVWLDSENSADWTPSELHNQNDSKGVI